MSAADIAPILLMRLNYYQIVKERGNCDQVAIPEILTIRPSMLKVQLFPDSRGLIPDFGGADRDRTDDLRLAKPMLSQLSYSPRTRLHTPGIRYQ